LKANSGLINNMNATRYNLNDVYLSSAYVRVRFKKILMIAPCATMNNPRQVPQAYAFYTTKKPHHLIYKQ
ncbi:MAG: hypothetical protein RR633_17740, partial [Acinetobacter sp.]